MHGFLSLWPQGASSYSHEVDLLVTCFTVLIVALSAPVFILIVVFAVKYRRGKPANRRHRANRNVWLEVSWSLIPFILLLGFYVWSTKMFVDLYQAPADAMEINVVAKQWMWKFQHPGGQAEINELHVPAGQAVKLIMASQDVIHSLFLPALRLKQDVLPGRFTSLSFTAERPGVYRLSCTQFCGTDHSLMGGSIVVQTPSDYARWLSLSTNSQSLTRDGGALFQRLGCGGCHGVGATVRAPPLPGLYQSLVPLEGGGTTIADDQYLRDSILLPQSQIVAGYPAIMPTYQNVLGEEEVMKLVAYLKSLNGEGTLR